MTLSQRSQGDAVIIGPDPLASQGLARLVEHAAIADTVNIHSSYWTLPADATPILIIHHSETEVILNAARTLRVLVPDAIQIAIPTATEPLPLSRFFSAGIAAVLSMASDSAKLAAALTAVKAGLHCVATSMLADGVEETPSAPGMLNDQRLAGLTPRQQMVARELAISGLSGKALAVHLGISQGTLKIHASAIYRQLGVSGRQALTVALRPTESALQPSVQRR